MLHRCDILGLIDREGPTTQKPALLVREARQFVENFS
jgi:hypothetical protein